VKITTLGAAETVTGSCHLLEIGNEKILVDCGMFQGGKAIEQRNDERLPVDPATISKVFLTHGHLDHCGRLPLLVRRGFHGQIICTPASAEIIHFILLDSAHLMYEDYVSSRRRHRRRGMVAPLPLYDEHDVMETLSLLSPVKDHGIFHEFGPHMRVAFHNAGHILGSRFLEMEIDEGAQTRRVIFSGDLGNTGRSVMPDYELPKPCDVVYCESTYGDRNHRDHAHTRQEFDEAIVDSLKRGGNVVIPSFALERSQDILFALEDMHREGRLPKGTRVYLNSPLAINMTRIYHRYREELGAELRQSLEQGNDPFSFPGVKYTKTEQESRDLNKLEGGNIFIAGSGMCNGGRVLHHLKHNLWRKEASVILVGYQAQHTLGRLLVERRQTVRIFGDDIKVEAQVFTVNGFSAHAGKDDLLTWLKATGQARVRLVHGESKGLKPLQRSLESLGRKATIVQDRQPYGVDQA